jgi:hypothetical protein
LTGAIIYGLSQKSWREFGVAQAAAGDAGLGGKDSFAADAASTWDSKGP